MTNLREYVCPEEVNKDIDDLAVYLNTTYYPVDVQSQGKSTIAPGCISEIFHWYPLSTSVFQLLASECYVSGQYVDFISDTVLQLLLLFSSQTSFKPL